eukprot:scaffold14_cov130-Cylindrotheca_fusiformis.AAC.10
MSRNEGLLSATNTRKSRIARGAAKGNKEGKRRLSIKVKLDQMEKSACTADIGSQQRSHPILFVHASMCCSKGLKIRRSRCTLDIGSERQLYTKLCIHAYISELSTRKESRRKDPFWYQGLIQMENRIYTRKG